ncbi:vWA domain-containing protein [Micromonospora sp. DT48]|uniref:vWA domain-containing protein n=1 Tax=unclassified Micromonospora TaxID=2617518 RepID=UPI0012BD2326|nr:vWA domain-containing protein [Micromonospora sp. CP22]MTK04211.1 VWA domain-containing protein [Micromonospora sp. CP22]
MDRRTVAAVAAALTAVVAACLPGLPAAGASADRDEVYAALGVNQVAADYVVLVDVSGSMRNGGRYEQVKRGLRTFLAALAPDDRVALVTFADSTRVVHDGPAGRAPDQLVAKLPRTATGRYTDIGAAIETSLRLLRADRAAPIATVLLLTDGRHDPPAGSAYPFEQGYSWNQLVRTARSLRKTSLNAYAVPLSGSTGAPLLARVYPDARVLKRTSIDRLGSQLEQPKSAARAAKARGLLGDDVSRGVRVSWPAEFGGIGAGRSQVEVRLTSTTTTIPLVVDRLVVRSDRPQVRTSVPSGAVELPAGGTVTVPITVEWDAGPRRTAPLARVTEDVTFTLEGEVGSPWAGVLTGELGLDFVPRLEDASTPGTLSAQRGSIGWWLLGAALVAALVAAGWWARKRRLYPPPTGTVRLCDAGGDEHDLVLTGRRTAITADSTGLPGYGEVTARRASLRASEVRLVIGYSRDGTVAAREVGECELGKSVELGGVTFTWRTATPGRAGLVGGFSRSSR